jgi:hypothetical protein
MGRKKLMIFLKRLAIFPLLGVFFIPILARGQSGRQVYNLRAQEHEIRKIKGNFDEIRMDGFYSYSVPGFPDLPAKLYYIALPPDVDEYSIEVDYSAKGLVDLGSYRIKEISPLFSYKDNKQIIGDKAEIYPQNNFFPEKTVEYLGFSQMRKWRLVRLRYTPFQYNPDTKNLLYIPRVEVRITYEQKGDSYVSDEELADTVMDERAREIVMNYSESYEWYNPRGHSSRSSTKYDYVIITTNTIKYGYSHYLSGTFLSHLKNKGYNPLIVTETDFGGLTGQYPNGTAEKMRKWLQNHYLSYGIKYVLFIGNPDPLNPEITGDAVGDIPMKACLGRGSDYFYADLTGNWDLDGDGLFGEYYDDSGTGGVDFVNEVYVGRIPYYSGADDLVSVIHKIRDYGKTSHILWRRSALLPTSYQDPSTDGAYWAEAMISGYLTGAGFTNWTMYQQGSACTAADSTFTSDEELRGGRTLSRWSSNDYGMVWWQGHGSDTGTLIGWSGCWDGNIMTSTDVTSLDDNHPAFVFQSSCNNGAPDASNNLGKSLLYDGAIATVCTNETSWYGGGDWSTTWKYVCDDRSIGYYYGEELVTNNKTAGEALYDVKSDMGVNDTGAWKWDAWKNLFGYNLYGDPSVSILENGLGPALDNNNLLFLTLGDGTAVWYHQISTFYHDGDAAQSGNINDNETVSIYTTVKGPGLLKFYWQVSSELNHDFLSFYIAGILRDQISGEKGWAQKTYKIPSGLQSLRWSYEKDSSGSSGYDCGWVDKVEYWTLQEDLIGSWTGEGIYYRNTETGKWVKMGPPGNMVAVGDLDGDETGDVLWSKTSSGFWAKHSGTGSWSKLSTAPASDIASGDMNGDGRADAVGIWTSGVYYKNSIGGAWIKVGPVGDRIATGDLDGDGTDDLLWSKTGEGVWVKHSSTAKWKKLCVAPALSMASGDMNGDGRDDLVGTWTTGTYYKNSIGGAWVKMGPPGDMVAVGDLDGDGTDDLLWSKTGDGVWVKHSSTAKWMKLCGTTPVDMNAGLMRGGINPWPSASLGGYIELPSPMGGGYGEGPGNLPVFDDLSNEGPGGLYFIYSEEENLVPHEKPTQKMLRHPGPGEVGFRCIEEENIIPKKEPKTRY